MVPIAFLISSMFLSQNRPSLKSRAPQHEHLVETRAKPNPDLQSQRWTCSFSRLCAKRTNATQKRSVCHHINSLCCSHVFLCSFVLYTVHHMQVKNVYQTSFSAFLDSLDLLRSPDFPQVRSCDSHNICSTVWFHSIRTYCFH